jgi:hypothetical protein
MAAIIMSFLADWPADAPEFGGNSAILECGRLGNRPELPGGERQVQPLHVAFAVGAAFYAIGQLG